jgi:hypothetical protein
MKYSPTVPQNSNNYIWAIAALAAICIWFFVTYDLYANMSSLGDEITTLEASKATVNATLAHLNELETESKSSTEPAKYIGSSRDDILLEQIFALSGSGADIGAVSIDSGELLTSGITLSGISLSVEASNLQSLLGFIDRATAESSQRRFLVKSLSFAYDRSAANLPITATLQLWAYTSK